MALSCIFGFHSWNGCKCIKCGKTHNEGHDWSTDCEKCSICGSIRANVHQWDKSTCTKCGKTRTRILFTDMDPNSFEYKLAKKQGLIL